MATKNRWQVGAMYGNGYLNGQPFYTQPGGIGTAVFPATPNSVPWLEFPIPGLVINCFSPWFSPGCLHAIKQWKMIQEYDYDTESSVELVCCFICGYVQSAHFQPAEEWLNPLLYPIIIG
jgi:hypothetical protein